VTPGNAGLPLADTQKAPFGCLCWLLHNRVGAELARDEAITFSIIVDSYTAIASKLGSYKEFAFGLTAAFFQ
jgi:hypothetical protein